MTDWPLDLLGPHSFGILGAHSLSGSPLSDVGRNVGQIFNGTAVHVASTVYLAPLLVQSQTTVFKLGWINGATVSGNIDVGIYDPLGNRLVSTGSTAQAGISSLQIVDTADLVLAPGRYYTAFLIDNATGTVGRIFSTAVLSRVSGAAQVSQAIPLPATLTFAAFAQSSMPLVVGATDSATF